MDIPQTKLREVVLQALYAYEIDKEGKDLLHPFLMECVKISKKNVKIAEEKAQNVLSKKGELDLCLQKSSEEYELERISVVDREILRLSLYEFFFEGLPLPIVIDEAIRLSRKFSTSNAATFVQALLNTIGKGALVEPKGEIKQICSTEDCSEKTCCVSSSCI